MKTTTNNVFTNMTETEISQLVNTTNETVAADEANCNKNQFTAANLWNIQKMRKQRVGRRLFV